MVAAQSQGHTHGIKVSTVLPAAVTADGTVHELSNMDLAMKLHYLRAVYYYNKQAAESLSIYKVKESMFVLLQRHVAVAGRVRKSESGRPHIKCNDSGVRILEAQCNKTIEEWLELKELIHGEELISNQVLGPDLRFSPLLYLQFTKFKCGGMSIAMNWSHILGDAFTASNFIKAWGNLIADNPAEPPLPTVTLTPPLKPEVQEKKPMKPLSVSKPVEPAGDYWTVTNTTPMETTSFHISGSHVNQLLSNISSPNCKTSSFEAVSAFIWQTLAKIRGPNEPNVLTLIKKPKGILSNQQAISTVSVGFSVSEARLEELAVEILKGAKDETKEICEYIEADIVNNDAIVYGGNLTFVDLEGLECYELKLAKERPVYASYSVEQVGDAGVVFVLPGAGSNGERVVTVTLPKEEVSELKSHLNKAWNTP
ncbi:hypothetical protein AMTRI_Chr13g124050 [Amborella trichopoda]|uniref:Uncharacterized protein n=1 Tax=Amborella trichopoda TaxID=13333 RepID=U5CZ18_AMBTC|nr:protein ECERIFERUM 26-like [Amborella trichopoda]ERN14387.1 hypothetical protein AMTR_s00033p00231280 [Amborella trichopoda]|eukprot:XP_006852920.1 protein ECERIFERUM 26-like [Amborella trichopoda]